MLTRRTFFVTLMINNRPMQYYVVPQYIYSPVYAYTQVGSNLNLIFHRYIYYSIAIIRAMLFG